MHPVRGTATSSASSLAQIGHLGHESHALIVADEGAVTPSRRLPRPRSAWERQGRNAEF
jgi:hypothetical protein